MNKPTKHIFVCTSSRMTGVAKGFCHTKGAIEIIQRFTEKLEEEDITDVMVSNTGCFGICEKGPIVTVYPDNVWYGSVSTDDVDEIETYTLPSGENMRNAARVKQGVTAVGITVIIATVISISLLIFKKSGKK